MHVATANGQYPAGIGDQLVGNGGHLYIEYWSNHVPVRSFPLQGGRDGTKLRPEPYAQNVLGDPHFYFALARRIRNRQYARTVLLDMQEAGVKARRLILVLIGAVAVLAAGIGYFFVSHPCSDIFPCHDSKVILAAEQRELLAIAISDFENQRVSWLNTSLALPKPLQVRIAGGPEATLTVAGPLASNSLAYAAEWYRVYHLHHGGTRSVSLHVVWKTGSVTQTFPVSEF